MAFVMNLFRCTKNVAKCRIGLEGLTKKTLGLKDLQFSDNPTMEEVETVANDIDPRQLREVILPVHRGHFLLRQMPCLLPYRK